MEGAMKRRQFFSLSELRYVLLGVQFQESLPTFDNVRVLE